MHQDATSGSDGRHELDGTSTVDLSGRCVGSSYVLVRPIGQGATGTVWRGVHSASGEPVAIKLLHESLLRQPKLVTRFVQERTILLMLRHRNVVRVRDLFSVGESLGLVMDLVSGGSLRDHLREHGTLAAGEAARLAAEVAAALAEAHDLNVIHRDLKPDNILLQSEGGRLETRLTDFGIARVLSLPSITTPNAVVGTPHYMAPEAFHGAATSPAADVYALGIVLYEMVTGRPPFHGDSVHDLMQAHLAGDPERPPGIPGPLWDLIMSCLAAKPRLRPDAAELVAALTSVARAVSAAPALPALALPEPPPPPPLVVPAPAEPAAGSLRHSIVPVPRVPKRPHNKPRSWRWARPGTVLTVLTGTMLASGVATTAWHVTRSGAQAADVRVIAAPTQVAPVTSAPPPSAASSAPKPVAPAPARVPGQAAAGRVAVAETGRPDAARTTAAPAKPAVTRKPQPEARPYGPWECRQAITLDMRNPVVAKPCQSAGKDVRMSAALSVPAGGRGSVTVALQEGGRNVAGPYTCSGLVFTDDDATQECGPRTATARRGRTYAVLMTWSVAHDDGKITNGRALGESFTF